MSLRDAAAYMMAVLGGKDSPKPQDIKKILESVDAEYDEEIASKLCSELEGKTIHEVVAEGKEKLKGFGGGGGGAAVGGAPAAEAKQEAVVEEEEEEDMDF